MIAPAFDGHAAWRAWAEAGGQRLAARHRLDQALPGACGPEGWPGLCRLCDRVVDFQLAGVDPAAPNLRESLLCPGCGLNARVRAGLWLLDDALESDGTGTGARVYLTEQASRAFVWAQRRYAHAHGSEYVEDPVRRGHLSAWLASVGGQGEVRFGDVTALHFGDATLDGIASFDVLEHVPDHRRALAEFARVLRPGGHLVLTAPFLDHAAEGVLRARLGPDGQVEHLLEPEYHGDPVSGGVLCFHHFGWDLLGQVRAAGFAHAEMVLPWDPAGGWPIGLWTLRARR